jgi:hypothetical protein
MLKSAVWVVINRSPAREDQKIAPVGAAAGCDLLIFLRNPEAMLMPNKVLIES